MKKTTDNYLWLEDNDNPRTTKWIEEQNQKTRSLLMNSPEFRILKDKLAKTLAVRNKYKQNFIAGDYIYATRFNSADSRGCLCRTPVKHFVKDLEDWEIILDLDYQALDKGKDYLLSEIEFCPFDHDRCILFLSEQGLDKALGIEYDITARKPVENGFKIPESRFSVGWLSRDELLIRITFDAGENPMVVKHWRRGELLHEARTILTGEESSWINFETYQSGGRATHFILDAQTYETCITYHYNSQSQTATKLSTPDSFLFEGFTSGQVIFSTLKGEHDIAKGSVFSLSLEDAISGNLNDISCLFLPSDRTVFDELEIVADSVYIVYLDNIISKLSLHQFNQGSWHKDTVQLPETGSLNIVSSSPFHDGFLLSHQDFLSPISLSHISLKGPKYLSQEPHFFSTNNYQVLRYEAEADDGIKIPYFWIGPKEGNPSKPLPTFIYVYGGFNTPLLPVYCSSYYSTWLAYGGALVFANIRGGSEFGPRWYQAALREKKKRSALDLIAVTEDLVTRQKAHPGKIGLSGESNGGLVVAMAMNLRPELYKAVLASIPLLDMIRYHLYPVGDIWISEYGDPNLPDELSALQDYSPYHNIHKNKPYPAILLSTSSQDDRVYPAHARKMAAKLQEFGYPAYFHESTEGGHNVEIINHEDRAQSQAAELMFFKKFLIEETTAQD